MPFGKGKKKPAASYSRTGESRTTLGDGAIDFRVRNGNGYDNSSMATGKGLSRVGPRPACPRKYLPDYATQRVLRWLLEGGMQQPEANRKTWTLPYPKSLSAGRLLPYGLMENAK